MKLRFFKLNGHWYADVPNHTLEENEMVCGSDKMLDRILAMTDNDKSEVFINFTKDPRDAKVILFLEEHDEHGGYYYTVSPQPELHGLKLWICNVTHDVLGEHPEMIMIS